MSLTQSRQFTISTYDPPSTPIALKAHQAAPVRGKQRKPGSGAPSRKSVPGDKDYFENLKNSGNKTPEVNKKGTLTAGNADDSASLGHWSGYRRIRTS